MLYHNNMNKMKRTTVRIKPSLYIKANEYAIYNNTSFQSVVNEGLFVLLNNRDMKQETKKTKSLFEGMPTVSFDLGGQVIDRDFIYGKPSIDNIR